MARAIARAYAAQGHPLQLAARDRERLSADAKDLEIRYMAAVSTYEFDALDTASHPTFWDSLSPKPETVVCAIGLLGNQKTAETDWPSAATILRSNFEGPASILSIAAAAMETKGRGCIIAFSSVAGDRGRASNYYYGSAKAGLTTLLSGLRNRLAEKGVHVVTVKPGFVATRMTAGMDTPKFLTAQVEEVAKAVLAAEKNGRDIVYVRRIWFWVMMVIRLLPEFLFKRTRL